MLIPLKKGDPLHARMLSKRHLNEDLWNYILELANLDYLLYWVKIGYYNLLKFSRYLIIHPTIQTITSTSPDPWRPPFKSRLLYGPGFAE